MPAEVHGTGDGHRLSRLRRPWACDHGLRAKSVPRYGLRNVKTNRGECDRVGYAPASDVRLRLEDMVDQRGVGHSTEYHTTHGTFQGCT